MTKKRNHSKTSPVGMVTDAHHVRRPVTRPREALRFMQFTERNGQTTALFRLLIYWEGSDKVWFTKPGLIDRIEALRAAGLDSSESEAALVSWPA